MFGEELRRWRTLRGLSQERLALEAEVSTRHLSFLETGRSAPSREMVLVLASALELTLRERNVMLQAAGYAAVYRESSLGAPELAEVSRALDYVLDKQEPYPCIVIDRTWNLLRANRGARRMLGLVVGMELPATLPPINGIRAIFEPGPLRGAIANWDEIASVTLARLAHEVAADPSDADKAELLRFCRAQPGTPDVAKARATTTGLPFVPVVLAVGDLRLRFFTMLTSLGTPNDVTAQEVHLESYFPADAATEAWLGDAAPPRAKSRADSIG